MAMDKIVDSAALDGVFTQIAAAIRDKNGQTEARYAPAEMPGAIAALSSGGGSSGSIRAGMVEAGAAAIETGFSTLTRFILVAENLTPANSPRGLIALSFRIGDTTSKGYQVIGRASSLNSTTIDPNYPEYFNSQFHVEGGTFYWTPGNDYWYIVQKMFWIAEGT